MMHTTADRALNGESQGSDPHDRRQPATEGDDRLVWMFWGLFVLAACAFVALRPHRSVTAAYFEGASHWLAGLPLYARNGTGFLYLPPAAILFVPFAVLPSLVGNCLWRLVSIGCYAWGVRRLTALAERRAGVPLFGLVTLIAIPLAWSSAHNGQATLPMAGLMMAAISFISVRGWWSAAICLVLAITVKPLAVVLVLLSVVLYRPLMGRLLAVSPLVLAFPFFTQDAGYVLSQYVGFTTMMQLATDRSNIDYFAQVFGLLRVTGCDVPQTAQTVVRAIFAGLTLAACLWFRRRVDADRWGVYFFTLAACYLMLFNPRTENNTYSLLAPAIGVFFAEAVRGGHTGRTWLLVFISLAILGCYEIGRLVTTPLHSIWLAPLAAIAFTALVLADLVRHTATERTPSPLRRQPEDAHSRDGSARAAA